MTTLIEAKHSKYGVVKLEVRLFTHPTHTDFTGELYPELQFYYPSGAFMGSWDREMGGGLSHPNEQADLIMRATMECLGQRKGDISLLDVDEAGYFELENVLEKEVRRLFPNFLITPIMEG